MQTAVGPRNMSCLISDSVRCTLRARSGCSSPALKAFQASKRSRTTPGSRCSRVRVQAIGGGPEDKKTLTREEEPQEYWQTAAEKKGQNPMKDPLAIIGLLAIFLPFIILAIAIGTGVVDTSGGRG